MPAMTLDDVTETDFVDGDGMNEYLRTFTSGVFTVDRIGIVKIDWLCDDGAYQGEFGIPACFIHTVIGREFPNP